MAAMEYHQTYRTAWPPGATRPTNPCRILEVRTMPDTTTKASQAQAAAHNEEARAATAAAAADDEPDDDAAADSGDDLPPHARALVQRANRQAAKSRKELQQLRAEQEADAEARRKAQLTADQRAVEAEAKAQRAQEDAEAKIAHAQRLVALAGKVTHPERVLRLMDDPTEYFDGSTPDLDRIRGDFPEYAPAAQADRPPARAPGAAGAPPRKPSADEAEASLLKRGDLAAYAAAVAARQAARRAPPKE